MSTWSRPFEKGDRVDMIPAEFKLYRKKHLTLAGRIEGPFDCVTSGGLSHCEDGWLAFDSRGYPYPIAADEFEGIYVPERPVVVGGQESTMRRVINCARCEEDHDSIEFHRFRSMPKDRLWTHWGVCPCTLEPILMMITELSKGLSIEHGTS